MLDRRLKVFIFNPVRSLNWSSCSSPHVSPPTPRAPPEQLQRAGSLLDAMVPLCALVNGCLLELE